MSKPKRIDPPDCGCTDCITGYSEPLSYFEYVRQRQLKRIYKGKADNATGMKVTIRYDTEW